MASKVLSEWADNWVVVNRFLPRGELAAKDVPTGHPNREPPIQS